MKCLYFLLLVAASQAYVPRPVRDVKDIPVPNLNQLTLVDPPGFILAWTTVQSLDSSDPILGYKVKVWEQPKIKQYHYEIINGNKVLVEEIVPGKFPEDKIPEGTPREIVLIGADKSTVKVEPIEAGVAYEARVQAYTKTRDGPLSQPMRIQIVPNNKDRQRDLYTVD